jgi:hypothetical protein
MAQRKKRGRKNAGWFRKGTDPRRRRGFSKDECRKGYAAAKQKCRDDPHTFAWLWRKLRGHYRAKGTWYPQQKGNDHGEEEDDRCGGEDPAPDIPF